MLGFSSLASMAVADDGVAESSAITGAASANISLSGAGMALVRISATAAASLPFGGFADGNVGVVALSGIAIGGIAFAGAAQGQARLRASGSGGIALTGQGIGRAQVRGAAFGLIPLLGAAVIGDGALAGGRSAMPGTPATGGRARPSRTGGTLAWTRNGCRIVRDT